MTPAFLTTYSHALWHEKDDRPVAQIAVATTWWEKGIGVIPLDAMPVGLGLWLPGVTSVHTCFVRFSLDLLFLDRDGGVMRFAPSVRSWTPIVACLGAAGVVELGSGTLQAGSSSVKHGEKWILRPIGV